MTPPRRPEDVHVLHVVRTLGKSGGMERNLYRVVKATAAHGMRHSIALLSDYPDVIDFSGLADVTRIVTPPNDPRLVLRLREHMQRVRPTVVHSRNWGAWPDAALARLAVRPRPAMVFSYHGMEHGDGIPWRRRLAFQALAASTTRMFAVSAAARDLVARSFGVGFTSIDVIPNGVDTERFRPAPERDAPHEGPVVIGASGRFHPIKNFPLLLEAVARLPDTVDARVRIAGDGPLRPDIEAEVRRFGLEGRVTLLGHVDDMPAYLRDLDVFVLSSDNEANPNALLEALSTGLACVSTAVGGAVEVSDEGRAARLVPARDPAAMANALSALCSDGPARRALGQRARRWILDNYDQSVMIRRYEALYRAPRREGR